MELLKYPVGSPDIERDFGVHEGIHEWWYATGVLHDEDKNLYSYQFTVIHSKVFFSNRGY